MHTIAIASGKGGVGKSTVAVNLALALKEAAKAQVGLLDADVHGPSQPLMLGVKELGKVTRDKRFVPIHRYGLQTMSIGYLMKQSPVIWRGPMISKALQQMFRDTAWDSLDYLILDLPPGTGDIPLTLVQKIPLTGVVIVTTPQAVAKLDAGKSLEMFEMLKVKVLGVIENMSLYQCTHCGHEANIFGQSAGKDLADAHRVSLLGQLPLDIRVRDQADRGVPVVEAYPDSDVAMHYKEAAKKLILSLAHLTNHEDEDHVN